MGLPLCCRPSLLITRMSADQIGLHSVQLPLLIAAVVCVLTLFLSVRVSKSTHFPQM